MRIFLQAEDPTITTPPDKWILFQNDGNFNIAGHIADGYNYIDVYAVGGGGGGGAGGQGNWGAAMLEQNIHGGGGGAGGGGGGLAYKCKVLLSGIAASNPVTIGKGGSGGSTSGSSANGQQSSLGDICTGYGGGGGGNGSDANNSHVGYGGGGGAGGGLAMGNYGENATNSGSGKGGKATQDSGAGTNGSYDVNHTDKGGDGKSASYNTEYVGGYGGGGGAGGGRGTPVNGYESHASANNGGSGGNNSQNFGYAQGPKTGVASAETGGYYYGGEGGGGGGGLDLTKITGFSNLYGNGGESAKTPGGGGNGGAGGVSSRYNQDKPDNGHRGADGCVLIRVYYMAV